MAESLALTVQADGYAPTVMTAPCPAPNEELKIRLQTGATIHGRVLNQDSAPVSGAQITIENWAGSMSLKGGVETDARGEFAWEHAPEGSIAFRVTHPDFLTGRATFVPQSTGVLVVRLGRPVRLTATVVAADSQSPIVHGRVFDAGPESKDPVAPMAVVHEGRFSMTLNPARGSRTLRVESPGYLPATVTVPADPGVVVADLAVELRRRDDREKP